LCGVVPGTFACVPYSAADVPSPATSCTSDQVHAFIADCWDSATASAAACAAWASDGDQGMTACGVCLNAWTTAESYPDTTSCYYMFIGGTDATTQSKCRNAMKCINGCGDVACNSQVCDDTDKDVNGNTEYDRCYNLDSVWGDTGTCMTMQSDGAAIGTTVNTCIADATYKTKTYNCRITSSKSAPIVKQIEGFYRGACRDNGDWSNVNTPPLW
jgi:hypothetical protein